MRAVFLALRADFLLLAPLYAPHAKQEDTSPCPAKAVAHIVLDKHMGSARVELPALHVSFASPGKLQALLVLAFATIVLSGSSHQPQSPDIALVVRPESGVNFLERFLPMRLVLGAPKADMVETPVERR